MKAIVITNPGPDSKLQIQKVPTPVPGDHQILVKIEATALNRADLIQRQGKYSAPEGTSEILGLKIAIEFPLNGFSANSMAKIQSVFLSFS